LVYLYIYFFFSSRRRHTRSKRDWSSDVCSSDLVILNNDFTGYTKNHWLIFLALAIFPTFFGHTIFNWALKWVSTSNISMAIVFEPIGASILAYFILGEVITYTQWLGGFIFIFGLFLFIMSTAYTRKITIDKKE